MSDSTLHKKSDTNKPETQFTTENIGKWASKQENPFAEQNRKAAAKKQKQNETRKKATPIVAIIAGVIAAGVAICGLIFLIISLIKSIPEAPEPPAISGNSSQDVTDYQDILNNFYNQNTDASEKDRLQAVQDAVDSTLGTANGKEYANQVLLAQAMFYYNNGMYPQIVELSQQVDEDRLTDANKRLYYNILYSAYAETGEPELSKEYLDKLYVLSNEMSGEMFEYYDEE